MRSPQAVRTMTPSGKWSVDVRSTVLGVIGVVLVAALVSMLRRGPPQVKRLQVRGTVQNTRIVADHALQTKWGGQLTWKEEYKVAYSIAGREYVVWADSGVRGDDEDGVRLLLPRSQPSCWVQYNPQSPAVSVADCR